MTTSEIANQLIIEQDESTDNTEFFNLIVSWIDDAVDEIADSHDWKLFKPIRQMSTVASQQVYALDEDVTNIRAIRFVDTDEPIDYIDEMTLTSIAEDFENLGKPRYWFFTTSTEGTEQLVKNIAFSPIPDAIYPLSLSLQVHPNIVPLTSSDDIPFRKETILAIKHRVRAYVLMNDKDYEGARFYLQAFYDKLEKMIARENKTPIGQMLVMQPRDLANQNDRRYARLDPSHFRN
jgi:hypothetical protein